MSAGESASVIRVYDRMSQNITVTSTCLPPSARPDVRSGLLRRRRRRELPEELALLIA